MTAFGSSFIKPDKQSGHKTKNHRQSTFNVTRQAGHRKITSTKVAISFRKWSYKVD